MAAFKVKNLWTAFIAAFFALLASMGLTTAATAAQRAALQTPDQPALPSLPKQVRAQALRATLPAPNTRWSPTARDRSLPPTIKQRIRAEAHGSSPATRHLQAIDADSAYGSLNFAPAPRSASAPAPRCASAPASGSVPAPVAEPALAAA
ncbi:DUF6344 domain-containing protein [Streptomyces sp. NPDC002730]|uniref:DUF6344 domain-containing protein n=1 Tax=Streptomyces sp. NPDC002730 TaxID=3364662 RepID=UPI003676385D